jgi:2-phosphosulfolactate phosphatase
MNRPAVANRLEEFKDKVVWIVGSGWEGSYSLEDSLCAGAVVATCGDESVAANDKMLVAALALWERY